MTSTFVPPSSTLSSDDKIFGILIIVLPTAVSTVAINRKIEKKICYRKTKTSCLLIWVFNRDCFPYRQFLIKNLIVDQTEIMSNFLKLLHQLVSFLV